MSHVPVLLDKVIECLSPKPGENFVDCTIGQAGHAFAILEQIQPRGKVLGIDADSEAMKRIKPRDGLILAHGNFKDLKKIAQKKNFKPINGILFDLGLSSWQIEESGRGFSFKRDEPLDMNLNGVDSTAKEIINNSSQEELTKIFQQYGEEKYSRRIAQAIKKTPGLIQTTGQLREIIERSVYYSKTRRGNINRVLARIFQALRIVVNNELENLKQGLEQATEILEPGGRLVVISFHSLEDRIVKNFFKERARLRRIGLGPKNESFKILTKKPIMAIEEEIKKNPRSRSAKLRAGIKF